MQEIKIFLFNVIDKTPILPFLEEKLNVKNEALWKNRLFQKIDFPVFNKSIRLVSNIDEADVLLIPHDLSYLLDNLKYINEVKGLVSCYSKKVISFFYSDSSETLAFANDFIVVRSSKYKNDLCANEIIMPAYVEDLSLKNEVRWREKTQKPSIGFTGWASFLGFKQYIKYLIKISLYWLIYFKKKEKKTYMPGIFFRRKAISCLKKDKRISTFFSIRTNYSGHRNTITISPEHARAEFIKNILNTDFSLVVKGDGNYSLRFFEVLSLGRIPLFIDTNCPLPLENIIDYDEFILRVPYQDINRINDILTNFYTHLDQREFVLMQKKAQDVFKNYLHMDVFLIHLFRSII